MISVTVKLSTTLRACVPDYVPSSGLEARLDSGASVADLADQLGLPSDEIKIVMVNGRHAALDQTLSDGDRVAYFPAVGGG